MIENPLSTVFGSVGVVYGLIMPLVLILLFALFLIASSLSPGAKARGTAQAMYCTVMMAMGVLLMTIAAIPTVTSVLAGESYASETYLGLLIVFAAGGSLFLWHDHWIRTLDPASRLVPSLIFLFTIKTIGTLTALLSGLSIVLTLTLGGAEYDWWVMPLTLFLYGAVLFISTGSVRSPASKKFSYAPLCKTCFKPSIPKKAVTAAPARKTATKKKAGKKVAKKRK
ncbi:MAG: hypothetical protein K9M03_02600 [Kiritimatiellales bacterium]|nr:hypothetical protein [Kiritimatiellales bacterium]